MARRIPRLRSGTVAAFAGAGLLLALVAFLLNEGLDRADQWSSVLAGAAALVSLTISAYGWASGGWASGGRARAETVPVATPWGTFRVRAEVPRLMAAQLRAAQSVPYRVPGQAGLPMAAMYVRQDLESLRGPAGAEPGELAAVERIEERRTGQTRLRVMPAARPVEQVLGRHRHLLVEGGPGLGKSSLARDLAGRLARAWLPGDGDGTPAATPVLPLLVSARALSRHRALSWTAALARAYADGLGQHADEVPPADLLSTVPDGLTWMVIVDGLDEVTGTQREALVDVIAERMAQPGQAYRIVLLSRPLGGAVRQRMLGAGVGMYTLLPFSRTALHDFAATAFATTHGDQPADLTARFLRQLRAADLDEVAAIPLLATIALTVFGADPGRGLPRTRFGLYEQYIAILADASGGRRRDLRARLRQRLAGTPGGPAGVEAVFDHVQSLVEHLALVQVGTEDSLLRAASDWCRDAGLTGPAAPWAADLVADVLTGTGLLTRRGTDLAFVHHTFAEHFAADHFATGLPAAFDHRDPVWRTWIDRGLNGEDLATAVLVRWTCRSGSPRLVDWLQRGSQTQQLLAATLIADGASATESQVAACLEYLGLRWATMEGNPHSVKLLRRLPRTPAVRSWAREHANESRHGPEFQAIAARVLADDPEVGRADVAAALRRRLATALLPVERTALAETLAALGEPHQPDAVRALTAALRDPLATAQERTTTAEVLAYLGEAGRAALDDEYRAMTARTALRPIDRAAIARVLAEVRPDRREEAVTTVRAALDDPGTWRQDRLPIAQLLAELEPDSGVAREVLLATAHHPYLDYQERIEAARALADLGTEERRSAGRALLAIAAVANKDTPWVRGDAAQHLIDLGAEYHAAAAELIGRVLRDPAANAWRYRLSAVALLRMPAAFRNDVLAQLPADHVPLPEDNRVCVTIARAVLDPATAPVAAATLRGVAADPFSCERARHEAAVMLAGLGPDELEDACAALTAIARRGPDFWGYAGVFWLAIVRPQMQPAAATWLRRSLSVPQTSPGAKAVPARMMLEILPAERELAAATLLTALHYGPLPLHEHEAGPGALAVLSRAAHHRMLEVLTRVATDATLSSLHRIRVCGALGRRGPAERRTVLRVAGSIAHDPHEPAPIRVLAAGLLGQAPAARASATTALQAMLADPHTPARDRIAAEAAWDRLDVDGPDPAAGRPHRIAAVQQIVDDPGARPDAIVEAYEWFCQVGAGSRASADLIVELIAEIPDGDLVYRAVRHLKETAAAADRERAVEALSARLGDPCVSAADIHAVAMGSLLVAPEHRVRLERELSDALVRCPLPAQVAGLLRIQDFSGLQLNSTVRRGATEHLAGLSRSAHDDIDVRVGAVAELHHAGMHHEAAAAAALLQHDPRLSAQRRCVLLSALARVQPEGTEADPRLTALALGEEFPLDTRRRAALVAADRPGWRAGLPPASTACTRLVLAFVDFRLDPAEPAVSVAVLRGLAAEGPLHLRWHAACVLAEIHTGRALAASALAALLRRPDLGVPDRCRIATLMGQLGPAARDQAAAGLVAVLATSGLRAAERRAAATALAGLSPVYRDVAAAHLLSDSSRGKQRALPSLVALAALSPVYRAWAVRMLTAVLDDPAAGPADRLDAALALSTVSGQQFDHGLSDDAVPLPLRLRAAGRLLAGRLPGWRSALPLLERVAADRCVPLHLRRQAAQVLPRPAAGVLLEICRGPEVHPHDRLESAMSLCAAGRHQQTALETLRDLALKPDVPARLRCRAATEVYRRSAAGATEMTAVLREIHRDETLPAMVRATAGRDLARLDPGTAAELRRDLAGSPPGMRIAAAWALGQADDRSRQEAVERLDHLAADPATPARQLSRIAHLRRSIERLSELTGIPDDGWADLR
ncbi:hypothetical protein [Paractinoplanes rishiriensis]|uniref:NACHT domain-containing protein n=1 Tax=Paractinoplanes rishiriensis TaxID=1050105 RepID=A0A919K8A0_9ACTN|nr:hypothetical protein [Actinoplanes rishiriensis]GIF00706.1 hypothetical protein Ari01nite_81700 [Actinoplanes rishiriensis]